MRESLLTFDKVREIVAQQFGGPVAREGWGHDGAFAVTLQRVADDEASGLVEIGRPWLIVQRVTGMIEHWPHLDYLDRVQRMTPVAC